MFYKELVLEVNALKSIDVSFDFTTDSRNFWKDFWSRKNGLGVGGSDPDVASSKLQNYHSVLWSRKLPNGKEMTLNIGKEYYYLTWEHFRFGSDLIITGFRYSKYRTMIKRIMEYVPNYKEFVEDYIRKSYTIGGSIIFPRRNMSINQTRGINNKIKNRWDLTLECIRRFYKDEESPLTSCLVIDKEFFELFGDFKGYVDYFFLQECVSSDYQTINFWLENDNFETDPLPKSTEDYMSFIKKELEFVRKRNIRIKQYISAY